MGFRLKTILGVACIEALLVFLLIWSSLAFLRGSNQEQLIKRAETTAQLFATMCTSPVLTLDLATLKSQVALLARDESLIYVRVTSAAHGVLMEHGDTRALDQGGPPVPQGGNGLEDGIADARADIAEGGVRYGWVEIGFADTGIARMLTVAKDQALMTAGVGMILSALFSLALGTYLTRQLDALVKASNAIGAYRFDYRLPVKGRDELSQVAKAFNSMAEELRTSNRQMEERIRQRTEELARANESLQSEMSQRMRAHRDISQILNSISVMLVGINRQGRVFRWSKAAEQSFQLQAERAVGQAFTALPLPWDWQAVLHCVEECMRSVQPVKANNIWYERLDGTDGFLTITASPLLDEKDTISGCLLLGDDITDVKFLEAKLSNAAKLEAIGQLAAGIAHEINTPAQYVGDAVTFLKSSYEGLDTLMAKVEELSRMPEAVGESGARILGDLLEEIDAGFIKAEVPKTIDLVFEGIERISTIVQAMRRFSYSGGNEKKNVNIASAIENTLVITRNEWKYVADTVTDFDPELSGVLCLPGEINQVLLNILVNAAHAIGDAVAGTRGKGLISVKTRKDGDFAEISIQDTGPGIPESAGDKIFNLFYTTKEVGKGTGQGLAIAYDIVVHKHGGALTYRSEPGKGTTFFIRLPINGEPEATGTSP